MLPRERVIEVIEHRKPDRIPIYGWVKANLGEEIARAFGSVEAFEDRYEFDFAHLFGGPGPYKDGALDELRRESGGTIVPGALLDVPLADPNIADAYDGIKKQVQHHKEERGRFVYVQTPGIFESLNGPFGIENHLGHLLLHEDDLHQVYRRQAEWNRDFANNCLDLGVDMVHISDDWGSQTGLLFSPAVWWRLIHPYHKITCEAVRQRGAYLSLHCDGNLSAIVDGVVDLGYQVVHPWQESAGMDLRQYKEHYMQSFVVMGGLDIQTTLGFGKLDVLRSEITRVLEMFTDGGLLFCTTHYVQNHCSIEELIFAFDLAYELCRQT